MDLLQIVIIVGIIYFVFCKKNSFFETFSDLSPAFGGTIQKTIFLTPSPPTLPEKTLHWDHTFATKSLLRDNVVHMNALVNYFPMQKPPVTLEKNEEEDIDITRAQFVPRFAKRT